MIPKTIITCWFGHAKERNDIEGLCRLSREKTFDNSWTFMQFDESNFDVNKFEFTKLAYELGYYAFVADFVRSWALYNIGGVYLDTDMLMLKQLDDELLTNDCFIGSCVYDDSFDTKSDLVSAGIIGANKNSSFAKELLDTFFNEHSLKNMNIRKLTLMTTLNKMLQKRGLTKERLMSTAEKICLNDVAVYPFDRFTCTFWTTDKVIVTDKSYGIHLYGSSWQTKGLKRRAETRIKKFLED